MITKENFSENLDVLNPSSFDAELQDLHEFVLEATQQGTNWEAYQEPEIKILIDDYFEKVNQIVKIEPPNSVVETIQAVEPPEVEEQTIEKDTSEDLPITAKEPEKINSESVVEENEEMPEHTERISDEIRIIRRFISLYQKKKSKHDILLFINAIQKAAIEKRIRKTSPYAKQVMFIQEKLVKTYNEMGRTTIVPITERTFEELKELLRSIKVYPSILLLKRYVNLNGKHGVKDKAKELIEAMKKAYEQGKVKKSDRVIRIFDRMFQNLNTYVRSKSQKVLSINTAELSGLQGIINQGSEISTSLEGIDQEIEVMESPPSIMTLQDARTATFKTIGLKGKYLILIGDACTPTHIFAYGPGGGGKSSFSLQFASYLNQLGYKILYVAGEQFQTPTFTALVNRLNIHGNDKYVIVGHINDLNPSDFDFVVLDSKDSMGIDVEDFRQLKKAFPNQSFIITSQGTKAGDYTGSGQWRNEVDTLIYCDEGIAKTGDDKNRWGGKGELLIYEDPGSPGVKNAA